MKLLIFAIFVSVSVYASGKAEFEDLIKDDKLAAVEVTLHTVFADQKLTDQSVREAAKIIESNAFAESFFHKLKAEPGERDFPTVVSAALILAFADKDKNYWEYFDVKNPAYEMLAKFCTLTKLFQLNLAHACPPGDKTPYSLAETFENKKHIMHSLYPNQLRSLIKTQCNAFLEQTYNDITYCQEILNKNYAGLATLNNENLLENFNKEYIKHYTTESEIAKYLKGKKLPKITTEYISQIVFNNKPKDQSQPKNDLKPLPLKKDLPPKKGLFTLNSKFKNLLEEEQKSKLKKKLKNFKINGEEYILTPPEEYFSPPASNMFKYIEETIGKFMELYPEVQGYNADIKYPKPLKYDGTKRTYLGIFQNMIKALDIYFFCTRFYEAIGDAIQAEIDYATAGNLALYETILADSKFNPSDKYFKGHDLLAVIGFPVNHASGKNHMFRPEYETQWLEPKHIAYFCKLFAIPGDPIKPNYHVEQALEGIKFKKPKPKDLANTLCENYALLGKTFIDYTKYLQNKNDNDKWKIFFELAFNGACADEYLKALVEWGLLYGPLSDAGDIKMDAPANDPDKIAKVMESWLKSCSYKDWSVIKGNFTSAGVTLVNYNKLNPEETLKKALGDKNLLSLKESLTKEKQALTDQLIFQELLASSDFF